MNCYECKKYVVHVYAVIRQNKEVVICASCYYKPKAETK